MKYILARKVIKTIQAEQCHQWAIIIIIIIIIIIKVPNRKLTLK